MLDGPTIKPPRPSPGTAADILRLDAVYCHFNQGSRVVRVLNGVDFSLARGQITALIGPSGVGKSTLLHAAGLLERTTAGKIIIAGHNCHLLSEREKTDIRLHKIGFVYQHHHLLPEFTVLENVMMPRRIAGILLPQAKVEALDLITRMGLEQRANHYPGQLSGGEQQRTALARALANRPDILLADEPTGNLDWRTADTVIDVLFDVLREAGSAAIIATHNPILAERCERIVSLHAGGLHDGNIHGPTPDIKKASAAKNTPRNTSAKQVPPSRG